LTPSGTAGKPRGREELNDERPDHKGLSVSDERVDAENAPEFPRNEGCGDKLQVDG
jgi:hypothetical protein